MADKEKKKKTTKKKDDGKKEEATPDAEPTPEKQPTPPKSETPKSPSGSSRASRGSRKAKRTGSSVFSMFTQKQVAEFKEAFQLMDHDKDGILGREDLRFIFDQVGRLVTDKELDEMLGEAPGPINFTQLLQLFASRMQGGGADDDDVVAKAFNTFDNGQGKIDGERLRHALMTWCEKFTAREVNDAYDHFYIDDKGMIDIESLINMLTGKGDDEDD
ncbi:myosin regulatory light chain 2 isoform X2 [Trichogramma pretiosum]|uniref:myosin regulatory light chain 2 isoform X1 n=1 Tax=Trichogramma pretiosum TaxID=7493 RepID=UPI0006C94B07|nr:myosin regulatory light chain 2 isoform X1 [Trichogramma pretiosum]XP_014235449.1 myosin regulatory light chain 2 isoform X2 [Trichogramma pretiosum]